MKFIILSFALVSVVSLARAADEAKSREKIVFMGSSTTDGFSWVLMLKQALAEADKPVPYCINGGLGGDVASGVLARLDRDALSYDPNRVVILIGANDALRMRSVADYAADMRAILEKLEAGNVSAVLATTHILGPKQKPEIIERQMAMNEVVRELAQEYRVPLADAEAYSLQAKEVGVWLWEPDQIHKIESGTRVIARAVLDALGHENVPLAEKMVVEPYPGVVTPWHVKAVANETERIDSKTVASLAPDNFWKKLELPQTEPQEHWWREQIRQLGYAINLQKLCGPAKKYLGVAAVKSDRERDAFVNVGAQIRGVWLNGEEIFRFKEFRGYHAGSVRIPVKLKPGENRIVIETGSDFFLSVTDDKVW